MNSCLLFVFGLVVGFCTGGILIYGRLDQIARILQHIYENGILTKEKP